MSHLFSCTPQAPEQVAPCFHADPSMHVTASEQENVVVSCPCGIGAKFGGTRNTKDNSLKRQDEDGSLMKILGEKVFHHQPFFTCQAVLITS